MIILKAKLNSQLQLLGFMVILEDLNLFTDIFLLSDESRIEKAVMANAGFYTFADDQISYPFGIKNMNVSNERLEWFLRLKEIGRYFSGDADNDPKHHSLPSMRKAKKQGQTSI